MKKLLWACAVALPFLALPADAKASWNIGNYEVDTGAKVWFNVYQYGKPVAGPWYLYWPYEAHFAVPAPGVSPYFPPPMTLPPGFGQSPPAAMPPANYRAPTAPTSQGYQPPPPNPIRPQGYWYYGR
jgi:hypothetical protein